MRVRPLLFTLLVGTGSAMLLAGCSGKPENSPVIRQKFAAYDKMTESVDKLSNEVATLNDQVRRLADENAELRLQLPAPGATNAKATTTGPNASATPTKPNLGAPAAGSPATGNASATKPNVELEKAGLAGAAPAAANVPLENAPAVLIQQQVAEAPRTAADNFKKMTAVKKDSAAPKAVALATTKKEATRPATKADAPKTANVTKSRGGSYHTIAAGETVDQIASKSGITATALLQANRIPKGARLAPGQRLFIPAK